MKKMRKNPSGQGMTEYILIVALIAVAVIAAVKLFGTNVTNGFNSAANQISSNTSGNTAGNAANTAANVVNSVAGH
jgi:Flp pilus assembly pilin Flp